ncbi:unnamed protein product [Lymnaea stagnalis]|uniref:G-protein coupled receptors family 1 profile domain-containing protein n=1 Tax=Lymnaea stagnalis TaxID=6523 RepID=A0AAV2HFS2_LYMST
MYASSYVLLATAVDRFYAICHPFVTQMWTARHAHTLAVVAWAASLFFSLPQVFIFSYRLREDVPGVSIYDCWAQFNPEWTLRAYITWMTASIFVVPTCVLGILYGKITWVVWKAGKFEENMMTKFSPTNTHQNGDSKIASGRSSPRRSNHRKSDKQSLSAGPVDANRCSQVTRDLCKIGFDNVAVQKTNINQDASVLIKAPKVELFRPGENGGRKRNSTHAATQFTEQGALDPDAKEVSSNTYSEILPSSQLLCVCPGDPLQRNLNLTQRSYANNSKPRSPGSQLSPEGRASVSESLGSNVHARNGSGRCDVTATTPVDAANDTNVTRTSPHVYPRCGVEVKNEGRTSQAGPGLSELTDEERADQHVDVTSRLKKGYLRSAEKTRSRLKSDVKIDPRDPGVETSCPFELTPYTKNKKEGITKERNRPPNPDITCFDSCLLKRASFSKHKYLTPHGKATRGDWKEKPNTGGTSLESSSDDSGNSPNYARQLNENKPDTDGYQFLVGGVDTRKDEVDCSVSLFTDSTKDKAGRDRSLTRPRHGASLGQRFSKDQKDSRKNYKPIAKSVFGSHKDVVDKHHTGTGNDRAKAVVPPGNMGISRAKIKTIKMTLTVVICYVLCWAPFFVGQMWAAYDDNAPYDGPFFSIIMLLASVNSCTNPWIYTIFSNSICQRTQEVLTAPCRWLAKACRAHPRFSWSRRSSAHSVCLRPFSRAVERRKLYQHSSFSTFA